MIDVIKTLENIKDYCLEHLDRPNQNLWKWENGEYVFNHFVGAWKYIEELEDE